MALQARRSDSNLVDRILRIEATVNALVRRTTMQSLINGSGPPSNSVGSDGDTYRDTVAQIWYGPKANGVWPKGSTQLTSIQGSPDYDATNSPLTGQAIVWNGQKFAPSTVSGGNAGSTTWVDVKASGARGNGTTDDTNAINSAISGSPEGSTIWFPPGTYLVSSTIVLLPKRTYLGAGGLIGKTVITGSSAVTGAIVAAQGWTTNATVCDEPIKMSGIGIKGPGTAVGSAHGLAILNFWSRFEDIRVSTVAGSGIRMSDTTANGTNVITNSCSEVTIHRCRVDSTGSDGIYQRASSGKAFLDGQIEDCYITNVGRDGLHLGNSAGWYLARNHIYGVSDTAIYADNAFATHVEDNYVEDFGKLNAANTGYAGIKVLQQAGGWPTIVSGNFVANQQAGSTATPTSTATWRNYDIQSIGDNAQVNVVNNMAWRNTSAGSLSYADAYTYRGTGTLLALHHANQLGASAGYTWRNTRVLGATATVATSVSNSATTLTDAASIATDASQANHFRVTLAGNRTLANPTNPTDGQCATWEVIQDSVGGRTLTLDTAFALVGVTLTLSTAAGKHDFITARYNAAAGKWYVTQFAAGG